MRNLPRFLHESRIVASRKAAQAERQAFRYSLASRCSPLERKHGTVDPILQTGKERNVSLAAALIDGTVIEPGKTLSYHHLVGRPSRWRGFRPGLELHDEQMSAGLGGGCCMVSNLLYLLALESGMEIVERHRHALDLFPDHDRTVPFGCGATVYYNFADLRFRNPLPHPLMIAIKIEDRKLMGAILSAAPTELRVEMYEVDHRFEKSSEGWIRENRIRRRYKLLDGTLVRDEEVAHNRARVMYDPESI